MTDDDLRHGTNAGYNRGCRRQCCRLAHAEHNRAQRKAWRLKVGYKPKSEYRPRRERPLPTAGIAYDRALEIAVGVYSRMPKGQRWRWEE